MPVETDIEKQLNALMERHGPTDQIREQCAQIQAIVLSPRMEAFHPEVVAYAFARHAAAIVAAMKISQIIRPNLADLLARDFYETVQVRARPGAGKLDTQQ